jgi:hypothetical protein
LKERRLRGGVKMKKGDYVRIKNNGFLFKIIRLNKNKGIVFLDLGDGTISRLRLEQVELVGE